MGTTHETDIDKITQIGQDLASKIEHAGSTEALHKIHGELDSYDRSTQLAVARAAFSSNQNHNNMHLTNVQIEMMTENVQKSAMPVGDPWLHSLSAEMNVAKKPINWTEHPLDSLANTVDNMLTPERKTFPIFEESQEEHNKQVAEQGSRPLKPLDIEGRIESARGR